MHPVSELSDGFLEVISDFETRNCMNHLGHVCGGSTVNLLADLRTQ